MDEGLNEFVAQTNSLPKFRTSNAIPESGETSRDVLFRAARSGSQQAMGRLFDECRQYLLKVADRHLSPQIQAKVGASDVVQEAFVEAYKIYDRFQGNAPEELLAWLVKILEFKIAQAHRQFTGTKKRDVQRELPLDRISPDVFPAEPSGSSRIAANVRQLAQLRFAIERLPEDYRLAIEMRSLRKCPFAEVARRLNRTTEAARRLWLRAVVRLRTELDQTSTNSMVESDAKRRPVDS